MVALITGVTGLVGSAVARELLLQGCQVKALVRDISTAPYVAALSEKIEVLEGDILDIFSLEKAIEGVDYVVHAAAMVSFSSKERDQMYKINVEGTANVVNVCISAKIKKLCFISSVAALGRPAQSLSKTGEQIQIDENQKWENSETNSHYAITKYLAECEVWRGQAEGLSMVILNPSIVLGEGDWTRSSTQLFKYVYDEKSFYTQGFLNYVDVLDLAKAARLLVFSDIQNERFCISAGLVSYKTFFETVADSFGKKRPSIEVKPWLMNIIWRLEALKSWITGRAPLITKETAKTSRLKILYKNDKVKKALDLEFRPLEDTIKRVCGHLANKN